MTAGRLGRLPRADPVGALLALLRAPETARTFDEADWDAVVRVARPARLLAALRLRLERHGVFADVPERVRMHLDAERTLVRFRKQMVLWELECIARALSEFPAPLVLLKGAAYVVQGFGFAEGRLPSDVDLMVPRASLDAAERALLGAGWQTEALDPYDERYYREWSHELPPMRYPEHPLELDLHHTILPLTGRIQPKADALFADAVPIAGTRFHVLCPADQVVHAATQLFQDSDCAGRLRDLVDFDALIGELGATERFRERLVERARLHGAERPLAYALRYAGRFLGTPDALGLDSRVRGNDDARVRGNDGAERSRAMLPPIPRVARFMMDRLVPRALLPTHPDRRTPLAVRTARFALFLRSHWLRMPPALLARHAITKGWRALRAEAPSEVE
ncbi:MAG: nucleotidyltransferase family protein [Burkholderiales bacterium]|nr:nucleotidyltransferase family protein [Burkholderiales bacterium]